MSSWELSPGQRREASEAKRGARESHLPPQIKFESNSGFMGGGYPRLRELVYDLRTQNMNFVAPILEQIGTKTMHFPVVSGDIYKHFSE